MSGRKRAAARRAAVACGVSEPPSTEELMNVAPDIQRESVYQVPAMCVCRQRYGGDGEADPKCPTCKGSGVMHYGVVERVKKEGK